jgi:mediator of RNA polymerase II transcription subunit 18
MDKDKPKIQEIFLYGQIDHERHSEVLSILSGLTASEPEVVSERHVIFRPTKASTIGSFVGGTQTINARPNAANQSKDTFYTQLVKRIKPSDFEKVVSRDEARSGWEYHLYNTPEPNQTIAGIRTVQTTELKEARDPVEQMTTGGYQ